MASASEWLELEPMYIPLPFGLDYLREQVPSPGSISDLPHTLELDLLKQQMPRPGSFSDLSETTTESSHQHLAELSFASFELAPALSEHLIKEERQGPSPKEPKTRQSANDADRRWWARSDQELVCPITNFPIYLLPYPPFKFRVDPETSGPHILVDGKVLAMQLIVYGQCSGIRELQDSDIISLDNYIQRCKFSLAKPGFVRDLARTVVAGASSADRARASEELKQLRVSARAELSKLKRIQDNRSLKVQQLKEQASQKRPSEKKAKGRFKPPPGLEHMTDAPSHQIKSLSSPVRSPRGDMLSL